MLCLHVHLLHVHILKFNVHNNIIWLHILYHLLVHQNSYCVYIGSNINAYTITSSVFVL